MANPWLTVKKSCHLKAGMMVEMTTVTESTYM